MPSVNAGRIIGGKIYANVDAYITHYGTHGFRGRFIDEGKKSKVILYYSGIFRISLQPAYIIYKEIYGII